MGIFIKDPRVKYGADLVYAVRKLVSPILYGNLGQAVGEVSSIYISDARQGLRLSVNFGAVRLVPWTCYISIKICQAPRD